MLEASLIPLAVLWSAPVVFIVNHGLNPKHRRSLRSMNALLPDLGGSTGQVHGLSADLAHAMNKERTFVIRHLHPTACGQLSTRFKALVDAT